ncbi:MAG TPA: RidA family protein [Pirellulales bacterium]|nr:RidA family protein [Pirellulales bacterium]
MRQRPPLEYLTPPGMKPSPVFSRVVRVNDPRTIYLSGIYADDPKAEPKEQVRQIFRKMAKVLEAAGSDMRHLVKATYYVTNEEISKALNDVRPEFYDPERPPAASKAMVRGVGRAGHSVVIDMIAVPASPVGGKPQINTDEHR